MADDKTAKLVEELRLLVDVAAERAQPWLHRIATEGAGDHNPQTCGWCPVCNAAALIKGDRSELAAKAAEHVSGLLTLLRMALTDPATPAQPEPQQDEPRVQHIQVVRRKSDQGSQC
ncbi:hypothetical protein ACFFQW_34005 [Umezawaea endophytica]|uniref:Uncharacterized protein n=1 Tax=Umezawaea endophytica TaxID=1654476 RepID=A0A9X3ADU8_9PSEU|nr:hypothetical protein [Umezawaea endophytica]MCS7476522.1 hypothetical protein [Umezawaea endophytica]